MPLTKKGAKILRHMETEYSSEKKAKQVFYASANKGRIAGVHHDADFAAETGEEPGKPVNVSKGVTPAMLNERAQAMNAPETHDDNACDAEPGARAAMAGRRAGQLKAHVQGKQNTVRPRHATGVKHLAQGEQFKAVGTSITHTAATRKASIAPAKARASTHARKFGGGEP